MKQAKKYPSQDDAQVLIDIMNHPSVYTGGSSDEFRMVANKFNAFPAGWNRLHTKAFGNNSPWAYDFDNKKNKRVLRWDDNKAKKLGI